MESLQVEPSKPDSSPITPNTCTEHIFAVGTLCLKSAYNLFKISLIHRPIRPWRPSAPLPLYQDGRYEQMGLARRLHRNLLPLHHRVSAPGRRQARMSSNSTSLPLSSSVSLLSSEFSMMRLQQIFDGEVGQCLEMTFASTHGASSYDSGRLCMHQHNH